jgi:Derlin-2/3
MHRTHHLASFLLLSAAIIIASSSNRRLPSVVAGRMTIPRAPPPASSSSLARRTSFLLRSERRRRVVGSSSSTAPSSYQSSSRLILIRGGGAYDDDDDDDDEEEEDESDFSDFDFDDGTFDFDSAIGAADDDFGDEGTLSQIAEAYRKTPPFTKAYLTASLGAALLGYATNGNDFPTLLQLEWKPILTKMQVWRPLTAFLNFGPLGLGYLLTAHFVWTYMSTLERLNHSRPYDFWLMMLFGSSSMVVGYSIMGLTPRLLGHNLSTFMVYVWSRYHEGLEVNMFELFNTRAELLPWFFLAQVSHY